MFSHDALRRAQGSKRRSRKLLEGPSSWQLGLTLCSTHTAGGALRLKSDISRLECRGEAEWGGGGRGGSEIINAFLQIL